MRKDIYKKGRRKEYYLVNLFRKKGFDIVVRTAGSHSPIDIIAIDIKSRVIKLIQSKRDLSKNIKDIDLNLKRKLEEENKELNNVFRVEFEAL